MRFLHDLGNLTACTAWGSVLWVIVRGAREQREDDLERRDREFARHHKVVRP